MVYADSKSVILSGFPVSGKSTLARLLSEDSGRRICSAGRIWRNRWEETHPNKEISFEDFWRGIGRNEQLQINIIAKDLSERERIIGEFRYVHLFDKDKCLLVFLNPELNIRASWARNRPEYSDKRLEEISEILKKRELDEFKVGIELFGADYRELFRYDLVLDSGKMSPTDELQAIKSCLRKI